MLPCTVCKELFKKRPGKTVTGLNKYCSRKCQHVAAKAIPSEAHYNWKPDEVREKPCVLCGKAMLWPKRKPISIFRKQKFCSKACRYAGRKQHHGKSHWNWRGGITGERKLAMGTARYRKWRKTVFERDNFTCQFCKKRGGFLEADHIKPWSVFLEGRFDPDNGRTLCRSCHKKTFVFLGNQFVHREKIRVNSGKPSLVIPSQAGEDKGSSEGVETRA